MDNRRLYAIQLRHVASCVEGLRMLDLAELRRAADAHGSPADRALLDAVLLALDILPDPHG